MTAKASLNTLDFVDELQEIGPGTVNLNADTTTYTYLEFKSRGRVANVTIPRAVETKLNGFLGVAGAHFVIVTGVQLLSSKRIGFLLRFESGEHGAYRVDWFGDARPEVERGFKLSALILQLIFIGGVMSALISLPLLLFFVGFMTLPLGLVIAYWSRKQLKQFKAFQVAAKADFEKGNAKAL